MSDSPFSSKDLSRYFDHSLILASAGVNVKRVSPELTKCFKCQKDTFTIYRDPEETNSHWFYCSGCGFKGDTVEVLSCIHNSKDLKTEIYNAIEKGVCLNVPTSSITSDDIDIYLNQYPAKRQQWNKIWKYLQDGLTTNLHPDIVKLAQKEHVWSTYSNASHKRITRFLGGGMRKDLEKMFSHGSFYSRKFNAALALNYQDVPGRICAMQFLGDKGESYIKHCVGSSQSHEEGGLAMLDALEPLEGTVFAVSDPIVGILLHKLWFCNSEKALKLVIFNEKTQRAWQSINAAKVVLWAKEIDWKLFDHARKVKNAYITSHPNPYKRKDEPYKYISDRRVSVVLETMENTSEPWKQFFIKWACSTNTPEPLVRSTVNKLKLDTFERNKLLEECPQEHRQKFERVMGDMPVSASVIVRGCAINETEDGWWSYRAHRSKERISDATIRINKELSNLETGDVRWQGYVKFKNQTIPFDSDMKEVEDDIVSWLRELCRNHGVPTLHPWWIQYLLLIAKSISNPQVSTDEWTIGIKPNGEIHFPRFKLINGKAVKEEVIAKPKDMPAYDVVPPVVRKQYPYKDMTRDKLVFLAISSTYIANMVARYIGNPPSPVLIVGNQASNAYLTMKYFAEISGMSRFFIDISSYCGTRRRAHSSLELAIKSKIKKYDYPAFIELEDGYLKSPIPGNLSNVYISASGPEASAACLEGQWTQIYSPGGRTSQERLPPMDDVINYFILLQTTNFVDVVKNNDILTNVVEGFCSWYRDYSKYGGPINLVEEVKKILYSPRPCDSVIDLCCWLHKFGKLGIEHYSFSSPGCNLDGELNSIYIDADANQVLIPHKPLVFNDRKISVHSVNISKATEDLIKNNLLSKNTLGCDGWIIPFDYFETRIKLWSSRLKDNSEIV